MIFLIFMDIYSMFATHDVFNDIYDHIFFNVLMCGFLVFRQDLFTHKTTIVYESCTYVNSTLYSKNIYVMYTSCIKINYKTSSRLPTKQKLFMTSILRKDSTSPFHIPRVPRILGTW